MLFKTKPSFSHISLELTSLCNLKCKYCYNIWKAPKYPKRKPFNSYRQARKTLKRLFRQANVEQIVFTGGEPFLSERFKELSLFVRMKKKQVSVITNGNAASLEDYRQLVDIDIRLFEIPVHSARAEIHDRMTDTPGSWEKSTESVRQLADLGVMPVVVVVITKLNYAYLYKTLQYISELGVRRIMLNRFNIGGAGIKHADELQMSNAELNKAFELSAKAGEDFYLNLSSNVCTPLCVVRPADYPNIRFTTCTPDVGKRPLTLDIFGNLRFCNHSPVVLGNIFKQNISDMLKSKAALEWNENVPEYCANCQLYAKCMAGCRAASQQLGYDLTMPDPVLMGENTDNIII